MPDSGAGSDRPQGAASDFRRDLDRLRAEFGRLQERLKRKAAPAAPRGDTPPAAPPPTEPPSTSQPPPAREPVREPPPRPAVNPYEYEQVRTELADYRVRLARCETERGEYRNQVQQQLAAIQHLRAELADRVAERDAAKSLAEGYREELTRLEQSEAGGESLKALNDEIQFLRFTLDRTVNEYMAARQLLEQERDRARTETDEMRRRLENCIGNSAGMILEWKERAELAERRLAAIRQGLDAGDQ